MKKICLKIKQLANVLFFSCLSRFRIITVISLGFLSTSGFSSLEDELFNEGPTPLEQAQQNQNIVFPNTAAHEQQHGTRRYVKHFRDPWPGNAPDDNNAHNWHFKAHQLLISLKEIRDDTRPERNIFLLPDENIAIARLLVKQKKMTPKRDSKGKIMRTKATGVIYEEKWECEVTNLPYLFASGLPANDLVTQFKQLSEHHQERITACFQRAFQNGNEIFPHPFQNTFGYDGIRAEINTILNNQPPVLSNARIALHTQSLHAAIEPPPYSDSEQSLRHCLAREWPQLANTIIDVCSWYDVCWRCADCLYYYCRTRNNIFIRASGNKPYCDFIYQGTIRTPSSDPLRNDKRGFTTYNNQNNFPHALDDPAARYIAHMTLDDINARLTQRRN